MRAVFIGRQPIFDRHGGTVGYELLFRDGCSAGAVFPDDDEATRRVIANALTEFGLDALVGEADAFVNVTARFLAEGWHRLLPPERTILEILERERVDDELLGLLGQVRDEGYRVAADDLTLDERDLRLVPHVDLLKLDLPHLQMPLSQAREIVGDSAVVLGEKIETHDERQAAHDAGFDLFQGYFFTRPLVLEKRSLDANQAAVLRLLAEIEDAAADLQRLAAVIESDPALTYKLLRAANAGVYALPRPVESVRDCVVLLGTSTVRRMAAVVAMSSVGDKPDDLAVRSLVRARLCELAANVAQVDGAPAAFTVGLLSLVDALVDRPMGAILTELPLSPAARDALADGAGALGAVLAAVVAWERGDGAPLLRYLPVDEVSAVVSQGMRWAVDIVGTARRSDALSRS